MVITLQYIIFFFIGIILTIVTLILDATNTPINFRKFFALLLVLDIIYLCFLNFPISLTLLVFGTGIIALIDLIFFYRRRNRANKKPGIIVENARSFFPVLLLVWVIRSFIIQPYHVPSGSLEPTIMVDDFIAVNQFSYGLRFPIGNFTIIKTGKPNIGDITLFYNPTNPAVVYIKRTIGTPGDHIVYKNKVLYVNGIEAKQQFLGYAQDWEPNQPPIFVERKLEDLNGIQHQIYVTPAGGETQDFDIVVPPDMYFMMGDNRDNSDDSRYGFGSGVLTYVPDQNLIGKAFGIWMSWDGNNNRMRWNRIWTGIH